MTAVSTEDVSLLMVFGYHPRSFAMRHFRLVEGQTLSGGRQVIVGSRAAQQMGLEVGDSLRLLNSNFRVVGIYETGLGYEEVGVVIGLREAQALTGKPHQVMYYSIKVRDPREAEALCETLKAQFPEVDFSITTEAVEGMSDFEVLQEMVAQVSFLAVLVGSLGMLNTMLMSVLERTREIGVLRALGWRRGQVLGIIVRESCILGVLGGGLGMGLGVALTQLLGLAEGLLGAFVPVFTSQLFVQAGIVAILVGLVGGLYPAWRATRMRPVEALRYE
jgi:ABC-type lipoprotein release transport system permease subunit